MENISEQLLLTFIVPCYNVEHFVQQCLDSIYDCDLSEEQFEIVCVNDCSPDNVQAVLEQNKARHENMRIVVHRQNKGWGGARNTGIREARGKYLWFVDSDDTIIGKGLKTLVNRAINERADVFCFNYRRVDGDGKELSRHLSFAEMSSQDGYAFAAKAFQPEGIVCHMGFVWRFLYRVDYLRSHQLFFPEGVCWEDTVYMPKAILECDRVAASADVLYSYRVNADSISGKFCRVYPAKLIFDLAFCAGGDLLRFSEEVDNIEMKEAFRNTAVRKYINGFSIHLFRTSKSERKKFYQLTKDRSAEVKPLKHDMVLLSKLLMLPVVGPTLAEMGAFVYGVTHK